MPFLKIIYIFDIKELQRLLFELFSHSVKFLRISKVIFANLQILLMILSGKNKRYWILLERLSAAIILIRGWKPLPQVSFY